MLITTMCLPANRPFFGVTAEPTSIVFISLDLGQEDGTVVGHGDRVLVVG